MSAFDKPTVTEFKGMPSVGACPPVGAKETGPKGFLSSVMHRILNDPAWFWTMGLMAYFFLVLVATLRDTVHGDVELYHRTGESILRGNMPYADFVLEYPPYAILIFLFASVVEGIEQYKLVFGAELLIIDTLVKGTLLWLSVKHASKRVWLPVILFSVACAFNHYFYLQRFDLVPAAISLALLVVFWGERYFLAGIILSFGVGVKLYPALFATPLLMVAWRREAKGIAHSTGSSYLTSNGTESTSRHAQKEESGRLATDFSSGKEHGTPIVSAAPKTKLSRHATMFLAGVVAGLLPLLCLRLVMPWERFLAFHGDRGLQVESIYASVLWLFHHLGIVDASWSWVRSWSEVTGPAAKAWLPFARITFLGTVGLSSMFAMYAAWRVRDASRWDLAYLSRLLLIPLLAFVAFNIVLSPQYLIWLVVLAALAALSGPIRNILLIILAAVVTPIVYPSPDYGQGLQLFETVMLVARNLMLVAAWIGLVKEMWDFAVRSRA